MSGNREEQAGRGARRVLPPRAMVGLWGFALLVIIALAAYTVYLVSVVDENMRANFQTQAQNVASCLYQDDLKKLKGTADDLEKDEFVQLRHILTSVQQSNPLYRYAYVMGQNDQGQLYYFAENHDDQAPEDKQTVPGDIYEEATPEFLKMFDTQQPLVEGPVTDQWGTWISAIIPLIDEQTHQMLGIVGLDIDARDWEKEIFFRVAPSVGFVVFLVLCMVFFVDSSIKRREGIQLMAANNRLREEKDRVHHLAQLAQEANVAKSNFLALVSHEMRTPLNGVIGMAELLGFSSLNEEQRNYLNRLNQSAMMLMSFISNMLDLSKIEGNNLSLQKTTFSVSDFINETLIAFQPELASKRLRITHTIEPAVPSLIRTDRTCLQQVLANLVSNAIKFTTIGEISVRVSVKEVTDERITLYFGVKDTGIGIHVEDKTVIFDRFSRADMSSTREFGGAGLGLSISKQLVEMLGGEIDFESKVSEGSVFWFTVPTEREEG